MHRKLRAGPPNIGTERGAPDRHNKQFVIKRRRTGVIVSKKSNGSPVPSEDCRPVETVGARARERKIEREKVRGQAGAGWCRHVKRIANCELALCPVYSNRYYPRRVLRRSPAEPAPGDALCRDTRAQIGFTSLRVSRHPQLIRGRKLNIARACISAVRSAAPGHAKNSR